jgi:hypothetical protein
MRFCLSQERLKTLRYSLLQRARGLPEVIL